MYRKRIYWTSNNSFHTVPVGLSHLQPASVIKYLLLLLPGTILHSHHFFHLRSILDHHTLAYFDTDQEYLDSPITVEEVLDSISSFLPAKPPGSDGLPIDLYKEYVSFLAPRLLDVYITAFQNGELPESTREAIIVVLLKSRKDLLFCDSYDPISLLQTLKSWLSS